MDTRPPASSQAEMSLQEKIESVMQTSHQEERWESIILFSSEGLLLASWGSSEDLTQDRLLEFAFSLIETTHLLEENMAVKEINIRSQGRRMMVFRYFQAWEEALILAAVVHGRKGYKRAMSRLIRHIQEVYTDRD